MNSVNTYQNEKINLNPHSFQNWPTEKMIFQNVRSSKNMLRNTISTSVVGMKNLLKISTMELITIISRKKNKTV